MKNELELEFLELLKRASSKEVPRQSDHGFNPEETDLE
jgi:hypothetical protein